MLLVRDVAGLEARDGTHVLRLGDGSELAAHAVVRRDGRRATAGWRRPGVDELTGPRHLLRRVAQRGARRAPTSTCSSSAARTRPGRPRCTSASYARSVTILYRGDSLAKSMSHYLIEQIESEPNIDGASSSAELVAAHGERPAGGDHVQRRPRRVDRARSSVGSVFVFIGAAPQTDWLRRRRRARRPRLRPHRRRGCCTPTARGPALAAGARAVPARDERCPACSRPATCAASR